MILNCDSLVSYEEQMIFTVKPVPIKGINIAIISIQKHVEVNDSLQSQLSSTINYAQSLSNYIQPLS